MNRRYITILDIFGLLLLLAASAPAHAHELPASAHPATAESDLVAQLLASVDVLSPAQPKLYSYVAHKLTWPPQTLLVCFWNGTPPLRAKIAGIADGVAALTPVKFSWGEGGSFRDCPEAAHMAYPVRVSFSGDAALLAPGDNSKDYFTSIGRSILTNGRRATMNLPFPPGASDDLYREKTLHEFCHVLGCLHEHQAGLCDKDFNAALIKAKYQYSDEQYAENFTRIPSSDAYYGATSISGFDVRSIMLYSIPADYFKNGSASPCFRAKPVTELSPDDRDGLKFAYSARFDPRLQKSKDFARLAAEYDLKAEASGMRAEIFRTIAKDWAEDTPLLSGNKRIRALEEFANFAVLAEKQAKADKEKADSFRLSPETERLLETFMATLPPED